MIVIKYDYDNFCVLFTDGTVRIIDKQLFNQGKKQIMFKNTIHVEMVW